MRRSRVSDMNPLSADLDLILSRTGELWEEIRDRRIFITGGTGFFGCWLLESFAWANDRLGLNAEAHVLTRDFEAFKRKAPHLAEHPAIRFQVGDVCALAPPAGEFAYVIHAAAQSNTTIDGIEPLRIFETILEGTRCALELTRHCGARGMLLTSSGAVYGRQPSEITHLSEAYVGSPDPSDVRSAYGEGKRAAELMCALYADTYGFEAKIARCFAFVGPYLPIDVHFAVGNFISDALQGGPIRVKGDGTPYRSYLYAADLAVWLWTILFRGKSSCPYNVGSEEAVSIRDLASMVAELSSPPRAVHVAMTPEPGKASEQYVPATGRARGELKVEQNVSLVDAIRRTVAWNKVRGLESTGSGGYMGRGDTSLRKGGT